MAALSIRDLDDGVKERLRQRAAGNGRSMEAEVRAILAEAVRGPERSGDLFSTLIDAAQELGGVELDIPPRAQTMRVVDFDP
jgi:plasmid stability protein